MVNLKLKVLQLFLEKSHLQYNLRNIYLVTIFT